jgi:hypothetical protein
MNGEEVILKQEISSGDFVLDKKSGKQLHLWWGIFLSKLKTENVGHHHKANDLINENKILL